LSTPCFADTQAPDSLRLGDLKVRLWYEETGRLSDNFDASQQFSFWNTLIGGGAAGEAANDALFTADICGDRAQFAKSRLTMTVTGEKGKVLARRVFPVVAP
jgi:hypothetical protein